MKFWIGLLMIASLVGDEIDDRIKQSQQEIKTLRIKAMQEEVGGAEQLRTNAKGVVEDIEAAEKTEDAIRDKENELKKLLQEKASR